MQPDISYRKEELFTTFYADSPSGETALREMIEQWGSNSVLTIAADSVIGQLRTAGYSVRKTKPVTMSDDQLLRELGENC